MAVPEGVYASEDDFVHLPVTLIEFMGNNPSLAIVWERIRFRCNSSRHNVVDEDGAWWPVGYTDLARQTGMTVGACRNAVASLERKGHIEARGHSLSRPGDRTKSYRVVTAHRPPERCSPNCTIQHTQLHDPAVGTSYIEEVNTKKGESAESATLAEFDEWYSGYPRKVGKPAARKAFKAARKKVSLEQLIEARDLYAQRVKDEGRDPKYVKHPGPWLNEGYWDDDYSDVKIIPSGFKAWWAQVVKDADVAEASRVLGLTWSVPDVPAGVDRQEFLVADRRSWLEKNQATAESRWATQFGDLIAGP